MSKGRALVYEFDPNVPGDEARARKAAVKKKHRKHNPEQLAAYNRRKYLKDCSIDERRKRRAEQAVAWRAANPVKWAEAVDRANKKRRYKDIIGFKERADMICAACGTEQVATKSIHCDHDHKTGKFRGWICGPCNRALGLLKDDPKRIEGLLAYLLAANKANNDE